MLFRSWGENKPHLAAAQCAEIAAEAGVKQLVITHLHPAIPEDKLLAEARTAYPRAQLARLGAVFEL